MEVCFSFEVGRSMFNVRRSVSYENKSKKKGLMKRKIIVLFIILIIAIAAGGVYWFIFHKEKPVRYKTAPVLRGDLTAQVVANGTVNPVTIVQVGSQISGTIIKLVADFNSVVTRGQVIAQIDPALLQAKVDQAQADLRNAQAVQEREKVTALDNGRTLKRYQSLLAQELISQMDVDVAQTKVDQSLATIKGAQAQVEQARANLASAQTNLHYATIRSPVNGIVISRNVDVGQTVAASLQAPTLFTIAQDLKEMEIHTSVDEADIGRIKLDQPALFTVDSYPGESFNAKVGQIRNAATTVQNVVTYDVVLEVKNPLLKLKPGMTANVSIITEEKTGVLKIPNAALRFRPPSKEPKEKPEAKKTAKGPKVYRVDPQNRLISVPLQPGISDGQYTEVVKGQLQEDDLVVVDIQSDKDPKKNGSPSQKNSPMKGPRF
jgi:HlyD family secretion protein